MGERKSTCSLPVSFLVLTGDLFHNVRIFVGTKLEHMYVTLEAKQLSCGGRIRSATYRTVGHKIHVDLLLSPRSACHGSQMNNVATKSITVQCVKFRWDRANDMCK